MDARCSNCAEVAPDAARYCPACGEPLGAGAREQRKVVTVLFADLVGSTPLAEGMDEEALSRVMDRFYAEMRACIEAHGGTVVRFVGDAVMAVWGVPVVAEDDAVRAVRAAAAAVRVVAPPLALRVGVNTGEVVVDPHRATGLLVGDAVNLAARLEGAAQAGEVLVGAATARLARDHVALDPVGPLTLKGKSAPVPAWRVVADRPVATPARRQTPLVGRDDELRRLEDALAAATASGATRLVTVVGSPGVGKSRLAAELAARAPARVVTGACDPAVRGQTLLPVVQVVRQLAGVGAGDDPDDAVAKLTEIVGEPAVAARLAALLGVLPEAGAETAWAVRRLLEAVAPVVVVLDDLHWGQPLLFDLLEHLAAWGRDGAVLVVGLARPELREVRPSLTAGAIDLEPLPDGSARALVGALLDAGDVPAGIEARIVAAAEGNPLFVAETVRMLVDDGVLQRGGDDAWIAAEAAEVRVPPSIEALIAARVDRLVREEREVVDAAAVMGERFARGAVADVGGASTAVDAHLEALCRRELVRPDDGRWLDERLFRFSHALIRDAAYRSLLKEARIALHERFAGWLDERSAGLDELVGFHLERSAQLRGDLGMPVDEVAGRAAARLHTAGREALGRSDLAAAEGLLARAVALHATDAARIDLVETQLAAGGAARAAPLIATLEGAEHPRTRAWAAAFRAQHDALTGARADVDAALAAADALLAEGDRTGEAKACHVAATGAVSAGRIAASEGLLDRALSAARAGDDTRRAWTVVADAARAALAGPAAVPLAAGRCVDIVRWARLEGCGRDLEASVLRCLALLDALRGQGDAARRTIAECRATYEELGLAHELDELALDAATVELLLDDPAAAEAGLRPAFARLEALGARGPSARAAALLARAVLEQDRADEALVLAELAATHAGDDLKTAIAWRSVRAEALARRGAAEAAAAPAREAVALTAETDALTDHADALLGLAKVLGRGAGDDAAREARRLYAAKGSVVGVARADGLLGHAARPAAGPPAAVAPGADGDGDELQLRYLELVRARDWDGVRATLADDFAQIDHRPMALLDVTADHVVASLRAAVEMAPDFDGRWEPLASSGTLTAGTLVWTGTWDGTAGELRLPTVTGWTDGVSTFAELFAEGDRAAVLAAFGRRAADLAGDPAEAAARRFFAGVGTGERAFAGFAAAVVDDVVAVAGGACAVTGRGWDADDAEHPLAAVVAGDRALAAPPEEVDGLLRAVTALDPGVVAEERLCSHGPIAALRTASGFVVVDAEGRVEAFADRDAAERRCRVLVGEHAADAGTWLHHHYCALMNDGEYDRARAMLSDDIVQRDHRQVRLVETLDADAMIASFRDPREDEVPDLRCWHEPLAVAGTVSAGTNGYGMTYNGTEVLLHMLVVYDAVDGLSVYGEVFEDGDRSRTLAAFGERAAVRASDPAVAAARRFFAGVCTGERSFRDFACAVVDEVVGVAGEACAVTGRGWDADDAEHPFAAIVTGTTAVAVSEPPELADVLGLVAGLAVEEILARHGAIAAVRTPDGHAVLADGRVERCPDAAAALRRCRRLVAETAPDAGTWLHGHFLAAVTAHDWDALREVLADDHLQLDRRPLATMGDLDRDGVVQGLQEAVRIVPDYGQRYEVRATAGPLTTGTGTMYGTLNDGPGEVRLGVVADYTGGLSRGGVLFEPDDVPAQLACFGELAADRATHPAEQAIHRLLARFSARDWDGMEALIAPGFVRYDHRRLGYAESEDGATYVGHFRSWLDPVPDAAAAVTEVVGRAGPSCAVVYSGWGHSADGHGAGEVPYGAAVTVAPDGRIARLGFFDPDDRDGMLAHLADGARPAPDPVP